MIRYLHTLSAILFYVLGLSFFGAYILFHNGIATQASAAWLKSGDLPLLVSGLLYGGLSVYESVRKDSSSQTVLLGISIPLGILFILLLVLNFR